MRRMVFFGSMMKTERMVKACHEAKLALRTQFAIIKDLRCPWSRHWSCLDSRAWNAAVRFFTAEAMVDCILHVVEIGNFTFFVPNDREGQVASRDLINILDPSLMAFHCVRRKADQLDAALGELGLELREGAKLCCAYWRVVLGMREENDPIVADEFVEVDLPLSSFGVKVGSDAAETEGLGAFF